MILILVYSFSGKQFHCFPGKLSVDVEPAAVRPEPLFGIEPDGLFYFIGEFLCYIPDVLLLVFGRLVNYRIGKYEVELEVIADPSRH